VSSIVNFGAFVDLGGVDGWCTSPSCRGSTSTTRARSWPVGDEVTVEVLDVDMDRERVSLSLKATQEDPWQHFARTHQIGQIVPGKVTKLVPFGAFVRVEEGIEGLVHISELAERHVEIPEQVVQVNDDTMVKIIDIDLERRRISLSLKQANESALSSGEDFDPTLYGMASSYDAEGNYQYPEGFDPETGRVARGLRRPAGHLGDAVRRGARPVGGAQEAGVRRAERRCGRRRRRDLLLVLSRRRRRRPRSGRGRYGCRRQLERCRQRGCARLRRGAAGAAREAHRRLIHARRPAEPPSTQVDGGSSASAGGSLRPDVAAAGLASRSPRDGCGGQPDGRIRR
jgi:predicted RNA-binding protein with RPS1 domain